MGVLHSTVDPGSDVYRANREGLLALLAAHEEQVELARRGGGERYTERHRQRGKLGARERIERLLDQDAPFLELSPLAAWGTPFNVGGSIVTGIGVVSGVECVIIAQDPTVRGGTMNPNTLKKNLRALEIARVNRLPVINLVESGGADLTTQADLFIPGGQIFRDLTQLSALRIPTIALVFGNSTAGGAYVPGMCDYAVLVEQRAKVFLGGPPLVKMATGEESDDEELGGASMHSRISGLSDYLAVDELDCIRIGRQIVADLNWRKLGPGPSRPPDEPVYDAEDLLGIASVDLRIPFDPRDVLARDRRRLPLRRVQADLRDQPRDRLGIDPRVPDRRARERARRALHGGVEEGDRVHPAREPVRHAAAVPPEHDGLHGRQGVRAGGDHQGRRQDDQRGRQQHRPAPDRDRRRVLRRGELRDVRPRLRPPAPLRVAERQGRGHGAGAARRGAVDRRP